MHKFCGRRKESFNGLFLQRWRRLDQHLDHGRDIFHCGSRAVSYCEVRVGEEPIDKPGFSMVITWNIVWRFEICRHVQGVVKVRMYDEERLEEEKII